MHETHNKNVWNDTQLFAATIVDFRSVALRNGIQQLAVNIDSGASDRCLPMHKQRSIEYTVRVPEQNKKEECLVKIFYSLCTNDGDDCWPLQADKKAKMNSESVARGWHQLHILGQSHFLHFFYYLSI